MRKTYIFLYTIVFVFTFFFLMYIGITDTHTNTRQYISSDDIIFWDDYIVRTFPDRVTLEGDISVTSRNSHVLAFYSAHQNITIYHNNLLIYKYPVENNNPLAVTSGYNWNFITLPEETNHLIINFTSPYDGYAGKLPEFYVGTIPAVITQLIHDDIGSFLICIIIFCIGAYMIAYWLYIRFHMLIKKNLLLLGIFSVFLAIWSINENHFMTLLLKGNIVCFYLAYLSLMMLPIPFALFVRAYYEDTDNKVWEIFCMVNVIQIIICILLQMFRLVDFRNTLWTTHAMMIVLMVIVLSSSVRLLRERYNSTSVKMHLICISICTITLGMDIFSFYHYSWNNNSIGRIGFLFYIIILGFSSVRESTALMKLGRKANTYQKLAYTDQMTKMSNRTAFNRDFAILSSAPNDIAVINLDLNNLKLINDSLGHTFGDEYITSSAKIISNTFAHVGKCYRTGGDEFVVIIEQASHFDFLYYFNLMEWSVDSYNARQKDIHMQIAYGYAIYDASIDKTLIDTQHRADKNMYNNKKEKKRIRS